MAIERSPRPRAKSSLAVVGVVLVLLLLGVLRLASTSAIDPGQEVIGSGTQLATDPSVRGGGPVPREAVSFEAVSTANDAGLTVEVVDDGAPVGDARVSLYRRQPPDVAAPEWTWSTPVVARTNAQGSIKFPVTAGTYRIAAEASGFARGHAELELPPGAHQAGVRISLRRPVQLEGQTVVRGTSEPVAFVELTVHRHLGTTATWSAGEAPPQDRLHLSSDALGRFTVSALAPGTHRIEATAPGYGRARLAIAVPTSGPVRVELTPSAFIDGFVFNADRSPVAAAEVLVMGGSASVRTETSAGGAFSVAVEGGAHRLIARHGDDVGAAPGLVFASPGETVHGVRIELSGGGRLNGKVVDAATRAPIGGGEVVVVHQGQGDDAARTVSDANGEFRVGPLPPGPYDVHVQSAGYSPATLYSVMVPRSTPVTVLAELPRHGSVEGRIVDSLGRAISDAVVEIAAGAGRSHLWSGDDGRYEARELSPGDVLVTARRMSDELGSARRIRLAPGERATVDLVIADTGEVFGRVLPGSGVHADRAVRVTAMPAGGMARGGDFVSVIASPGGRYAMRLPARSYSLSARLDGTIMGFAAATGTPVTVERGGHHEVNLTLVQAGRQLVATVLEPGGAPSHRPLVAVRAGPLGPKMFRAGVDGRFELPLPGQAKQTGVTVHARLGGRLGSATAGPDAEQLTIQLEPSAALHGQVRSASGARVDGFQVHVDALPGTFDAPNLDIPPEGLRFPGDRFELQDVPGRPVRIVVRTDTGLRGVATAVLSPGGDARVEVVLDPAGRARGRVLDARTQQPISGARVTLDGVRPEEAIPTNARGEVELVELGTGTHQVRVHADGYSSTTRSFEIVEGQEADLGDIRLDSVAAPQARLPSAAR